MKKTVYLIHGWHGHPENNWFPWLKKSLEQEGITVVVPAMPNPAHPDLDQWVDFLKTQIQNPDENTFLVGHSMGCRTILRYLEHLAPDKKIGGCVFVAGWVTLTAWKGRTEQEAKIVEQWMSKHLDSEKVKMHCKKFVALFSDNDPYVPLENLNYYSEVLGAIIILKKRKGHFSDEDGVKELPVVLEELLNM